MARVRHWQKHWTPYRVTTRTHNQAFYLAAEHDKQVIIGGLAFFQDRGDLQLFAYVIMNNHIHLIIQPSPGRTLAEVVRDLKKWTSRHNAAKPVRTPLWERRYDDNLIRSAEEMQTIINYIHSNPVRVGLVTRPEDYRWSSARNYAGKEPVNLMVTTDWR